MSDDIAGPETESSAGTDVRRPPEASPAVEPSGRESSASQSDDEVFPDEFKARWQAVGQLSGLEAVEWVDDEYGDRVDEARQLLTIWLARHLGYSRVFRRRSTLKREPLWELLSNTDYGELSGEAEAVLASIGRSLMPARSFMHPSVALATLAIWRNSDDEQLVEEAEARLKRRALPDEPEWLYEVVEVFVDDESVEDCDDSRSLVDLVDLVLEQSYWAIGARLAALVLVHRYGRWYRSAAESNLTRACDIAARQYPHESRLWLDVLADAARGGRLSFRWLEEPVQAAIRLSIDDPDRQQTLREFVEGRPFDADYERLEQLYRPHFEVLDETGDGQAARRRLLEEVEKTVDRHPTRAQRLLELIAIHEYGPRLGARFYRLRKALERLATSDDDELCSWLVGLYVHNATLEAHAAELVRRVGDDIQWVANPFAGRQDYEMYLVISDYDRAFEELTCKFDGVTLEHADKYAAARIKSFVHKRVEPSRIHQFVQALFRPVEWVGSGLTEVGVVSDVIDRGMERFETNIRSRDRRREVVDHYRDLGIAVGQFGDIQSLPVDSIDEVVGRLCTRRIVAGAVAGGVSGGLAPYSWGMTSVADIPVMLAITADVCSRFCWYFGFDPRSQPELPFEILAVALGGTRPEAIEPMLVRQNLHSHVVRKSIVVGALAHGGVAHLAGKGASRLIQSRVQKTAIQRAGEFARRAVTRNAKRRAARTQSPRGMPVVGAVLGAALNTVLMHDICEAAEAVLTDRFLERKYPEWVRHIDYVESTDDPSGQ